MKVLEFLNTIISIASGTIAIITGISISKTDEQSNTFSISSEELKIIILISIGVFVVSLLFQRKKISNSFSVIKKQLQIGGSNNRQKMG